MRLRFTIRDLLWLLALLAVCVAWWVDHLHTVQNAHEQIDASVKLLNEVVEEAAKRTQSPPP